MKKVTTTLVIGGIATGVLLFLKSGFWKLAALATLIISGFAWWRSRA